MITAMPRRRSGRRSASMAAARSPRTPVGALGMVAIVRSISCSCIRPDSAGTRRTASPLAMIAPIRLPPPLLRNVIAAAAATARSRFSQPIGAEVQAGRHVDHQPGLQLAVGDHLPHVRVGGARGDRPVHPAHVVAGLIDPRLPRLRSRAGQQPEVVAVQHAVELAAHRQLQLAQRRRQRGVTDLPALQ